MSSSKKLVLFDIDGTLITHVKTGGNVHVGWNRFIYALDRAFHITPEVRPELKYHGSVDKAILFDIASQWGITKNRFDAEWEQVKSYVVEYARSVETKQIYETIQEAIGLLRLLRQHPDRFMLGILTGNVDAMAKWKLRHVGIDPAWFTLFVTSDEFEDRISLAKSTFTKVEKELGLRFNPKDTIVIGDALGDVRCAKAIGAVSIIVLTGGHTRQDIEKESPDLLVDSLLDERVLKLLGLRE